MTITTVRGVTWDHPRGYGPLLAAAKAFAVERPEVRVTWEVRSLERFGDESPAQLAKAYDLIVFDHPFVGEVAASAALLPLDERLPMGLLAELAGDSVGSSYDSYHWMDHQWALPIDVAGHVCAYRSDLLARAGWWLPTTWDDVLELARLAHQSGLAVVVPLAPVDCFCAFATLCANAGEPPFHDGVVVSRETGHLALDLLRELASLAQSRTLRQTPIDVLEDMSTTDQVVLSPSLFGYNNYARLGFRPYRVDFGPLPSAGHGCTGALLGGAGIGVSSYSRCPELATAFVAFCMRPETQRSSLFKGGGQPGRLSVWRDRELNAECGGFFKRTLETLERAYLRPRFLGFVDLQSWMGNAIHAWLAEGSQRTELLLGEFDQRFEQLLQRTPITRGLSDAPQVLPSPPNYDNQ